MKIVEEDLSKARIQNIKLDKALKVAQDNLAVKGKVTINSFNIRILISY